MLKYVCVSDSMLECLAVCLSVCLHASLYVWMFVCECVCIFSSISPLNVEARFLSLVLMQAIYGCVF